MDLFLTSMILFAIGAAAFGVALQIAIFGFLLKAGPGDRRQPPPAFDGLDADGGPGPVDDRPRPPSEPRRADLRTPAASAGLLPD